MVDAVSLSWNSARTFEGTTKRLPPSVDLQLGRGYEKRRGVERIDRRISKGATGWTPVGVSGWIVGQDVL